MNVEEEAAKKRRRKPKVVDPYACKHGKKRSKSAVPYEEVCRKRYHDSVERYNNQFHCELQSLERMQPTAYEQLRFHRLFAITTFWPPLHTRTEIDYTLKNLYKLDPKITRKVELIMNRKY